MSHKIANSSQTINYLNSLIVERTGFMFVECTSFPQTTILSVWIYEHHFCWVLKCTLHRNLGNKNLFGGLGFSPSLGKDFDDDFEVATEQLTAVVDVTFTTHDDWSGNILIVWMVMRSINWRHHDQTMYQVTINPWVS